MFICVNAKSYGQLNSWLLGSALMLWCTFTSMHCPNMKYGKAPGAWFAADSMSDKVSLDDFRNRSSSSSNVRILQGEEAEVINGVCCT
jgi:hypothetical protein